MNSCVGATRPRTRRYNTSGIMRQCPFLPSFPLLPPPRMPSSGGRDRGEAAQSFPPALEFRVEREHKWISRARYSPRGYTVLGAGGQEERIKLFPPDTRKAFLPPSSLLSLIPRGRRRRRLGSSFSSYFFVKASSNPLLSFPFPPSISLMSEAGGGKYFWLRLFLRRRKRERESLLNPPSGPYRDGGG